MKEPARRDGRRRTGKSPTPAGLNPLRALPQVEKVLQQEDVAALVGPHPRAEVVRAVRETLAGLRREILAAGAARSQAAAILRPGAIAGAIRARLLARERPAHRRAVNGTGIILHTGLGRAVWPEEARKAAADAVEGYAIVEVDAETGERNRRETHVAALLRELTGAEAATVVNNNAGATLIILAALARGREVILSRGQMVEIGGSYRIPDIMAESGARLVGVGTTNRTYIEDYRRAAGPETGLLLQVHTSNYEIAGFAHHTALEDLVALGQERGIPVVSDLGSGCFVDLSPYGFRKEPLVADSVRSGADLVCFSGDKLLGGPQAGVIIGKAEAVERIRRHPLYRALRVDKVVLAGLEAVLRIYRDPQRALERIPALRMITAPEREVRARAGRFLRRVRGAVPGLEAALVATKAQTGSGSLPAQDLPSWAVALEKRGLGADALAAALRSAPAPIFTRVNGGKVLVDFRTLLPGEEKLILDALAASEPAR